MIGKGPFSTTSAVTVMKPHYQIQIFLTYRQNRDCLVFAPLSFIALEVTSVLGIYKLVHVRPGADPH
jgi:hypothetical protein